MKQEIHPDYKPTVIKCACGATFETGSTKENINVEICSKCHPFYTGKQKLVDTGGRIDKFKINQMAVLFLNTIGEAESFFGLNFAVFHPGNDVSTGGSADVNCKEISHNNHLSMRFLGKITALPQKQNDTLSL